MCNNYISLLSDLCAAYTWRKNGIAKEAIVLQWAVQTASWDFKPVKSDGLVHCSVENAAVLCKNHCERVTQIWLSATFWFGTFVMFLVPLGVFVWEIFCISIYYASTLSLHYRVYWLYDYTGGHMLILCRVHITGQQWQRSYLRNWRSSRYGLTCAWGSCKIDISILTSNLCYM